MLGIAILIFIAMAVITTIVFFIGASKGAVIGFNKAWDLASADSDWYSNRIQSLNMEIKNLHHVQDITQHQMKNLRETNINLTNRLSNAKDHFSSLCVQLGDIREDVKILMENSATLCDENDELVAENINLYNRIKDLEQKLMV